VEDQLLRDSSTRSKHYLPRLLSSAYASKRPQFFQPRNRHRSIRRNSKIAILDIHNHAETRSAFRPDLLAPRAAIHQLQQPASPLGKRNRRRTGRLSAACGIGSHGAAPCAIATIASVRFPLRRCADCALHRVGVVARRPSMRTGQSRGASNNRAANGPPP
jgi:hypothetical protein